MYQSGTIVCPFIVVLKHKWPISLPFRCRASQTICSPTWHRTDQHMHHSYKDKDSKKDDKKDKSKSKKAKKDAGEESEDSDSDSAAWPSDPSDEDDGETL